MQNVCHLFSECVLLQQKGQRAKLLAADNNEIDTMYIDRRNDPESRDGNMLVCVTFTYMEGFMQDKIIASYTCFGGHMDVNC